MVDSSSALHCALRWAQHPEWFFC